jgi:hypothetical protein
MAMETQAMDAVVTIILKRCGRRYEQNALTGRRKLLFANCSVLEPSTTNGVF